MPSPLRIALAVSFVAASAYAQPTPADRTQILKLVDANATPYKQVSKEIWSFAELGYHETKAPLFFKINSNKQASRSNQL